MLWEESLGDKYQNQTKYERPDGPNVDRVELEHPGEMIELPPPDEEAGMGMWEAIKKRRSLRGFDTGTPMTKAELSQLLWATQGLTKDDADERFRAAPSAGALHPLETYLVINRVEGVPRGIARYDVGSSSLHLVAKGDFAEDASAALLEQHMAAECGVVFIWVGVPMRNKPKYRDRAHRYIYLDAGHIGAQLHLASEALGLGCCAIGAFFDEEVNALVGADGKQMTTVYVSVVGHV